MMIGNVSSAKRAPMGARQLRKPALPDAITPRSISSVSRKPVRVLPAAVAAPDGTAVAAKAAAPSATKPTILVAEKLGQAGLDMLSEFGEVDTSYDLSPEDLAAKMKGVDAIIVRSATKVTKEVIEAAQGRLKVVGRAGVGIDNVDLKAATANGVMVVNAPNANTVAAAEHGIALICALSRNVAQADASVKAGKWERTKYVGAAHAQLYRVFMRGHARPCAQLSTHCCALHAFSIASSRIHATRLWNVPLCTRADSCCCTAQVSRSWARRLR